MSEEQKLKLLNNLRELARLYFKVNSLDDNEDKFMNHNAFEDIVEDMVLDIKGSN